MRGWNPAWAASSLLAASWWQLFPSFRCSARRGLCLQSGISPVGYWQAAGSSLRRQAFRLPVLPYFLWECAALGQHLFRQRLCTHFQQLKGDRLCCRHAKGRRNFEQCKNDYRQIEPERQYRRTFAKRPFSI